MRRNSYIGNAGSSGSLPVGGVVYGPINDNSFQPAGTLVSGVGASLANAQVLYPSVVGTLGPVNVGNTSRFAWDGTLLWAVRDGNDVKVESFTSLTGAGAVVRRATTAGTSTSAFTCANGRLFQAWAVNATPTYYLRTWAPDNYAGYVEVTTLAAFGVNTGINQIIWSTIVNAWVAVTDLGTIWKSTNATGTAWTQIASFGNPNVRQIAEINGYLWAFGEPQTGASGTWGIRRTQDPTGTAWSSYSVTLGASTSLRPKNLQFTKPAYNPKDGKWYSINADGNQVITTNDILANGNWSIAVNNAGFYQGNIHVLPSGLMITSGKVHWWGYGAGAAWTAVPNLGESGLWPVGATLPANPGGYFQVLECGDDLFLYLSGASDSVGAYSCFIPNYYTKFHVPPIPAIGGKTAYMKVR